MRDLTDPGVQQQAYARCAALGFEHGSDVVRRAIAKQLSAGFLMVRDAMFFEECHEIGRRVAGECRLREMWVRGNEVIGPAMKVGEVAASAAGNQDLLAGTIG